MMQPANIPSIYAEETKKGPSKPPLPSKFPFPSSNILDSIPNSAQLASIANAALHSIISTPNSISTINTPMATPPPPPPPSTHNSSLPPRIPTACSSSNSSIHHKPSPITACVPSSNQLQTQNQAQRKKQRKRGKRGNKKNRSSNPNKKANIEDIADDEETKTQEEAVLESMSPAKRNLIQAVELERRNHELTKIALIELHKQYGKVIKEQKDKSNILKRKLLMYQNHVSSDKNASIVFEQKQKLQKMYLYKKSMRLRDEQQLKETNKENQKLMICAHYLKQHIQSLSAQYQSLCEQQQIVDKRNEENQNDADFQGVINSIESLDLVEAESMNMNGMSNDCNTSSIKFDDPWFSKMQDENKMLERHIRLLRHIIDRETQRCAFREVIVGKAITPNQSPEKKTTEEDDQVDNNNDDE